MNQAIQFKLSDVTLGYDGHPAVHHLDGEVNEGSLTAVIGPNGAGKSTLIKALVGALKPLAGHIDRKNLDVKDIAYLPQANDIDRTFPATVGDLVTLGLWRRRGLFSSVSQKDRAEVLATVAAVGLSGFHNRPIGTLSGGQLQRALFARVLLQDAKVILLDEPFTAIDSKTMSDLISLIRRWHQEKRTVIAVLHDIELVREIFPETILLAREPVAWGKTADVTRPENLLNARRMNEAWDDHAPWCAAEVA